MTSNEKENRAAMAERALWAALEDPNLEREKAWVIFHYYKSHQMIGPLYKLEQLNRS
jgi:hypothetical protein